MTTSGTTSRTVRVSTVLDAPAETVWTLVRRPATLRFVARPLLRFPDLEGRDAEWRVGETAHTKVLLLGFLPVSRHRLTVEGLDPVTHELRTDEGGGLVRQWRHVITVEEGQVGGRCRYTDVVHIDAGAVTSAVALFAKAFYRWRHRRWRSLVTLVPTAPAALETATADAADRP